MLNLHTVETLIALITFFIAYTGSVTLTGAFRAYVADKMGDPTARYAGFMTLDPAKHIDLIGAFFLALFYFGWGRYVPVNIHNITGRLARIRQAIAVLSDMFLHLLLAFVGLVFLILLFGGTIVTIIKYMIMSNNVSYLTFSRIFPDHSSTAIMFGYLLVAWVYLNVVLGILSLISNSWHTLINSTLMNQAGIGRQHFLSILALIICIWFFYPRLQALALDLLTYFGYTIARLLGGV